MQFIGIIRRRRGQQTPHASWAAGDCRQTWLALCCVVATAISAAQAADRGEATWRGQAAAVQPPFYDPENPDYTRLQRPAEGLAGLPTDRQGYVDWMKALREGQIQPRSDLKGLARAEPLDLDIVMKNTKEMPNVVFPHRAHTLWLDCSNCHPAIFEPKAGAHKITMAEIFRGRYCGVCHDRVAFITFFSCDRCHRLAADGKWMSPAGR